MSQDLKPVRLDSLLLCTIDRFTLGAGNAPDARGHLLFSLVTLTIFGCVGAFCRRWSGFNLFSRGCNP
jgi:hypothetical protein